MKRIIIIAAVMAVALALPLSASADRAATHGEQAAILKGVRAEIGSAMVQCTKNTDRFRVSTVAPSYSMYEWFGTRGKVCEQGAGLILHRAHGAWKALPIYIPTDTFCGGKLERVYIDLLKQCIVDHDRSTFPRAIASGPGAGATRCGEYLDADDTNTLHVGVYLLRNIGPHKLACSAAVTFAANPPQRDAPATVWWSHGPIPGMVWRAEWSRYDGTVVIATHVDSTEPLPAGTGA